MKRFIMVGIIVVIMVVLIVIFSITGEGSFKRLVTISGVYSICKPDGYEVVCFLDADGKEGGMFCVPLANAGGACKK